MVGTNDSTNKNNRFYNSTLQAISRGGGYCAAKVGEICDRFFDMGALVKTQVENGISKLFNLHGQTVDLYDQAIFDLKDSGIYD